MSRDQRHVPFMRPFMISVAAGFGALAMVAGSACAQTIGPSTSVEPYLVPSIPQVKTTSILTTGEAAGNSYRMVGIPDGLGAFAGGRYGETFTLLMNHELASNRGITRAHGSIGSFVSQWTIDPDTLRVIKGQDLTPSPAAVHLWDAVSGQYTTGTTAWNRFCSSDLPSQTAFSSDRMGTDSRILLGGEEVNEGRAWARIATGSLSGEAWQLPRLGRLAFENVVASPSPQLKTVVMLLDDGNLNTAGVAANFPSEVYVYIGAKQESGHPIERAGLTNGKLYGVKIALNDGTPVGGESNDFGLGASSYVGEGKFTLAQIGADGNVSALSPLEMEQATIDAGVTRLQRIEDGAWDPRFRFRNDFYFVTTASITGNSRLWRLHFSDVTHPEKGGTVQILLKGDEGQRMLDNMTIDRCGRILMQEDPGNNARIAKVWLYAIKSGHFIEIAHHNPKFFDSTAPVPATFVTQDEESSGIITADRLLGSGWFLLDVQSHLASSDPELVEGGQLLALRLNPSFECDRDSSDDYGDDGDEDHAYNKK